MMEEIARRKSGTLAVFEPDRHRLKVAALDYTIEEAKRLKEWPALERAVDEKIEEQQNFILWWDATVQSPGGDRQTVKPLTAIQVNGLSVHEAQQTTGMRQQRVSDLSKRLKDIGLYREALLGAEYRAAFLADLDSRLVQQSLSNEHYTPRQYIEAARRVLGFIDLDPASCAEANDTIGATKFYTVADDGLKQPWSGRVWLNPPYGALVGKFIERLAVGIESGDITAAIALVNAHCTDTLWFRPLWQGMLCFTDHRINFSGDETRSGSTHGSVFIYFGQEHSAFIKEFSQFGAVVERAA